MTMDMHWKAGGISVAGFSHVDEGIPCQDAHAFKIRADGWLVAAVADGAGSAVKSQIGAQAYVSAVVDRFSAEPDLPTMTDEAMVASFIDEVNSTTQILLDTGVDEGAPTEVSRSDFAATIVMVVGHQDGGRFFHVGDGAAIALKLTDSAEATISKPQNGEYANETYFVTMDDWEDHLRVSSFANTFDTVLLMSDGVTPMAMTKGCEAPFPSFVRPVVEYLLKVDSEVGQAALLKTLTQDKIRAITGDDKTFFWASKASPSKT
jgi:hypothetical protein